MNKKLYIIAAFAVAAASASGQQTGITGTQQGQQELHKEITLEKDFVPVEKKATKKNTLPKVKRAAAPAATPVSYSDWTAPIDGPTTIPTMMPYGYHTMHNFSDKRGYIDLGGGMAANFVGSAGYRIIDKDNLTLGIWAQHNSTWTAKNSTKYITDEAERLKQKFNDNVFGLDLMSRLRGGTLIVGARGHFDSFNYYGGTDPVWDDANRQMYSEIGLRAAWEGMTLLGDRDFNYGIATRFNHAGYSKAVYPGTGYSKGANENVLNITLDGEYAVNDRVRVGLELAGDLVSHRLQATTSSFFLTTLSPYLLWENTTARVRAGLNLTLGNAQLPDYAVPFANTTDGARAHVAPNVSLDVNLTDGAAAYINLGGGTTLNTLSDLAAQNRYSDPNATPFNAFSPFDAEAGFKIGPFAGFSAKVFGGYGFFKGDLNAVLLPDVIVKTTSSSGFQSIPVSEFKCTHYASLKFRGMKVGGELNYKYRSLIEAKASVVYAHAGDNLDPTKWNTGYSLDGFDGPSLVGGFDLKVTPIRQLAIDLGLQYRGQRAIVSQISTIGVDENQVEIISPSGYTWVDLDDVLNLHAGASWKFDKTLTLWLKGNNLLNRRYDTMPGMGAQKINVMAGFALVF